MATKQTQREYLVLTTVTGGPIAPIPTRLVFMAESPSGHAPSLPFRNAAQTANQSLRKPKRKRQARTSTAASDSLERQMGPLAVESQGDPRQVSSIVLIGSVLTRNTARLFLHSSCLILSENNATSAATQRAMTAILTTLRKFMISRCTISHGLSSTAWAENA